MQNLQNEENLQEWGQEEDGEKSEQKREETSGTSKSEMVTDGGDKGIRNLEKEVNTREKAEDSETEEVNDEEAGGDVETAGPAPAPVGPQGLHFSLCQIYFHNIQNKRF